MGNLDIEQPRPLVEWLRSTRRIDPSESVRIRTLEGGVSNRTVLVERPTGEAWVLKQALPKLRVAVDWFSSPERVHREAMGLRWLSILAPPDTITPLIFEDPAEHVIAMRAVPSPHDNWKDLLLAGSIHTDHFRQFGILLGTIHREALRHTRELSQVFADRSFFEGLRLEPFYEYSATQLPAAAGFLRGLAEETRSIALTLVHGDYSPKNVLIRKGGLILLDHEVIHWGDPMFDVGFAVAHLLCKAHHLPAHRPRLASGAARFWEEYRRAAGTDLISDDSQTRAARHALGCVIARVAGRSQVNYLGDQARAVQRAIAVELLDTPPASIPALIEQFIAGIDAV